MAKPKAPPVWAPAEYEWPDASALQALEKGTASADQQKRALKWIIYRACRTYERTYLHGDPDASRMLEGRREAGLDIVKLLSLNLGAIPEAQRAANASKDYA